MAEIKLMEISMTKVLISITTAFNPDWRKAIHDVKDLEIKEIALFLTALKPDERNECFAALREIPDLKIPFCHARSDMKKEEYQYMIDNFGTELFNTHTVVEYPRDPDMSLFMDKMLLENTLAFVDIDEAKNFKGLCLDLAHLDDGKKRNPDHSAFVEKCVEQYPVLANHCSAIKDEASEFDGVIRYDFHIFTDLTDFDYISKYSNNHFGRYLALELINPISEQLEAKPYVEKLLADKGILD